MKQWWSDIGRYSVQVQRPIAWSMAWHLKRKFVLHHMQKKNSLPTSQTTLVLSL